MSPSVRSKKKAPSVQNGVVERTTYHRGEQPHCATCRHPLSFHGGIEEQGPCGAPGCKCTKWKEK